jgi:hypothetical protein
MNRIIVSTYLPSMYIPDQPFSLPTAPIRVLSLENGERVSPDLKGMEAITSPNYVTGLAAALLSPYLANVSSHHPLYTSYVSLDLELVISEKLTIQLIHPSTPKSSASLVLLPLPISSIPDAEVFNSLSQLSKTKAEFKLSRGSWTEDDDEPFSQVGMGGQKKVDVKREVDGMYM